MSIEVHPRAIAENVRLHTVESLPLHGQAVRPAYRVRRVWWAGFVWGAVFGLFLLLGCQAILWRLIMGAARLAVETAR